MKLNIRLRVIVLTIITILPTVILIFYSNNNKRITEENQQFDNLVTVAKIYSAEHSQVIEDAKHLLLALSITPEINILNSNICTKFLTSLLGKYKRYSNFGVADTKGNVICSAVPLTQPVNVSDATFFKATKNSGDFSVGEYRIGPVTGDAIISFGYPIKDGIIYSSIDLVWFNEFTKNIPTFDQITIFVLDQKGTVIANSSGSDSWIGRQISTGPLLSSISTKTEGTVEDYDLDGTRNAFAFEKIGSLPSSPFIISAIPQKTIFKKTKQDFITSLILSALIAVFSIGFAWWAGGILIIKQVEELKKIDKLKDDLISLISHQIRTPLTSIRWLAEILLTQVKYKIPQKQQSLVKDIHEVSGNIVNLVGTFLNISKIESGKIKLNFENIDLYSLVLEVKRELNKSLNKRKIKVSLTKVTESNNVQVDRKLMKQVYLNLINNAIKYSNYGGYINISIRKNSLGIISEVTDTGIGIPKQEQTKIFQKFYRSKNAIEHNPDGSGLGLYLVKTIIEAHKGSISFQSNTNMGTTFTFNLPFYLKEA